MFTYHKIDTAPEQSKKLMEKSIAGFGRLPDMHRILAEAPATYEAYLTTMELFAKKTTFDATEQQVVFMTMNFENKCHYCIPGHTVLMKMANIDDDIIDALREGTPLPNEKLEALRTYTKALIINRGRIGEEGLQAFLDAGYTKRQALEVLVGISAKIISNFTNALANTRLNEVVQKYAWVHPDDR